LYPAINFNNSETGSEPGWEDPDLAGIQGIMGRWRPNGLTRGDVRWTSPATAGVGFEAPSLQNRNIFDYHNNLFAGTTNEVVTEFDLYQAIFDQELFNGRAGIEIAFDRQKRHQSRFNAFSSRNSKQISIDFTTHQAPGDQNYDGVADRLLNENFGRPVVRWDDNPTKQEWDEQNTVRATAFGTVNFKDFIGDDKLGSLLGKHTITGLYEGKTIDSRYRQTRGAWWADSGLWPGSVHISNGLNDNFRRIVKTQVYLGPSAVGLASPDDVRIEGPIETNFPQIGDEFGIWYFNNSSSVDDGEINTWRVIENLQSANIAKNELVSNAFSLQSKFFGGNLVTMWARRHDKLVSYQRIQDTQRYGVPGTFDANGKEILPLRLDLPGINEVDGNFNEGLLFLEDEPASIDRDYTTTLSYVGNYPENILGELPFGIDLTGHYYEAESFEPAGISNNILNQPLANPFGMTREKGFTAAFLNGRFSIRYNEFKTINANARTNLGGGLNDIVGNIGFFLSRIADAEDSGLPFAPSFADSSLTQETIPSNRERTTGTDGDLLGIDSYNEYYSRIIDLLPPEVQAIYNYRITRQEDGTVIAENDPVRNLSSTRDFEATGREIDAVGQLTENLTVSLSVAQQKTVVSNTGSVAIPLLREIDENITRLGFRDLRDSPFQTEDVTYGNRYDQVIKRVITEKARDNTVSPEQREWRVNFVSRYDFNDGVLRGLSVGGALRYQDKVAAGYPNLLDETGAVIPDVGNPFFGPDELNGDAFIRYKKQFGDGNFEWTVQLNARNLYRKNGNDDIPISINPDGQVALTRIPNSREFFLTNTFSF